MFPSYVLIVCNNNKVLHFIGIVKFPKRKKDVWKSVATESTIPGKPIVACPKSVNTW